MIDLYKDDRFKMKIGRNCEIEIEIKNTNKLRTGDIIDIDGELYEIISIERDGSLVILETVEVFTVKAVDITNI